MVLSAKEEPTTPTPPSAPARVLGFALSSVGRAVAVALSAGLAPLELEPREFALLRRVSLNEGGSQQAMGERLGIPPSRMVGLVDGLQERGLLERRPSQTDRRAHALHLTSAGIRLLAQASTLVSAMESEITQDLDAVEQAHLIELLDRLGARLGVPLGAGPSWRAGHGVK